jgi:PKD repeat protein
MKKLLTIVIALCLSAVSVFAQQRTCASHDMLQQKLQENPKLAEKIAAIERQTSVFSENPSGARVVYTIPVVVHVVYRNTTENVSDAQVQSQITALNKDYRANNTDFGSVPSAFAGVAADPEFEFCLATVDNSGNAFNGIHRVSSTRTTGWGTNDAVKTAVPGWDPNKYLNIWVCAIGGGILGYATFPGTATSTTDGVVIDYQYFGTIGTATSPFDLGRTATHEVGHWLNLYHIWGDATCGNDQVSDTPLHNTANYGCPTQPHLSTCSGTPREMTMNYMDYTDDACMYMFSAGQKTRMRALFATGGTRAALLNSTVCGTPQLAAGFSASTTTLCLQTGNQISFSDESTGGPTSWSWYFEGGTPSTSTAQNPTVTYAQAGTYAVSLTVSNAGGSDTYQVVDYINVLANNCIPVCNSFTSTTSVTIPTTVATVTSTLGVTGTQYTGSVITDVNVTNLNVTHTYIQDLRITLTSPAGTSVILLNQPCGSQNNLNLGFDDQATTATLPCPPTSGALYIPSSALSAFNGESMAGTWTLKVEDLASQDGGTLNGWTLQLCGIVNSCDVPTNVHEVSVTVPTAVGAWDAMPNAISYQLQGGYQGSPLKIKNVPTNTFTYNKMRRNRTYVWQVRTVCSAGTSDWSPLRTVVSPAALTDSQIAEAIAAKNNPDIFTFDDFGVQVLNNPVSNGMLNFNIYGTVGTFKVQITDINGRVLTTQTLNVDANTQPQNFQLNKQFTSGVYILNVIGETDMFSERIVVL